ncbi:hypothetical protein RJ55_00602 [Drechmeria coniospora]|nr:hypothetical protein RJ55_00602 [Drechmeria coniospora]
MRPITYGTILALASSGVLAGVINKRDSAIIINVLNEVKAAMSDVETSIKSFNGDLTSLDPANKKLDKVVTDGTDAVSGMKEQLTLVEAIGLQKLTEGLETEGKALVAAMIAKRDAFKEAGGCDGLRQSLKTMNSNSAALTKAIISKVPEEAQAIAQTQSSGLNKIMEETAKEFSEEKCPSKGPTASSASTNNGVEEEEAPQPTASVQATPTPEAGVATGSVETNGIEDDGQDDTEDTEDTEDIDDTKDNEGSPSPADVGQPPITTNGTDNTAAMTNGTGNTAGSDAVPVVPISLPPPFPASNSTSNSTNLNSNATVAGNPVVQESNPVSNFAVEEAPPAANADSSAQPPAEAVVPPPAEAVVPPPADAADAAEQPPSPPVTPSMEPPVEVASMPPPPPAEVEVQEPAPRLPQGPMRPTRPMGSRGPRRHGGERALALAGKLSGSLDAIMSGFTADKPILEFDRATGRVSMTLKFGWTPNGGAPATAEEY